MLAGTHTDFTSTLYVTLQLPHLFLESGYTNL